MASASYMRVAETMVSENVEGNPVGVGITASVASSRLPQGEHRAHIVIITKDHVVYREVVLPKSEGREARQYHDALIATATLNLLKEVLSEKSGIHANVEKEALDRFYLYPIFHTNGTRLKADAPREREIYLPATLNPIHDGHRAMCKQAEDFLSPRQGRIKASYLVSSVSPHKGRLSVQDMLFKAGMLRAERWEHESRMVEFTQDEPLFIDKARKRPGSIFLIGADTMQRMLDSKWGPDVAEMLQEIKNLDVKFLVMERLVDGHLLTCRDIPVPWPHGNLFEPLTGRVDISSTEIRNKTDFTTI